MSKVDFFDFLLLKIDMSWRGIVDGSKE